MIMVLLVAAWIYRDNLQHWAHAVLPSPRMASLTGRPSTPAARQAARALDSLRQPGVDSVILTPDEMASLLARSATFLPGETLDSLTVQLGERSLDVRSVIDSARIPPTLHHLMLGDRSAYEVVRVSGTFTPVQPGQGEFAVGSASVHGIPLPHALLHDLARRLTGRDGERISITLPAAVAGFRVRPSGVTVYHQRSRP